MGFRKFKDRRGRAWHVRPESKSRWWLEPLQGNEEARRSTKPPGYTGDPFELSEPELQRLLEAAQPVRQMTDRPSLFKD